MAEKYEDLDNFAANENFTVGLSCHHCRVQWIGCAAAADCPRCGAGKFYHIDDPRRGQCACEVCAPELHQDPKAPMPRRRDESPEPLLREFAEAIVATATPKAYWPMNALAKKLDLYIDDLGTMDAWRALAKSVLARPQPTRRGR